MNQEDLFKKIPENHKNVPTEQVSLVLLNKYAKNYILIRKIETLLKRNKESLNIVFKNLGSDYYNYFY